MTGSFDLGLVEGVVDPSTMALHRAKVGSDRLRIVVGQTHPWFERMWISVIELTTTAWIMREPGSGTR